MIVLCWKHRFAWVENQMAGFDECYHSPYWVNFENEKSMIRAEFKGNRKNTERPWRWGEAQLVVWTFLPTASEKSFMAIEFPGVEQITHLRVD